MDATDPAGRRGVAAATVLYKPDAGQLEALLAPLDRDGIRVFVFLNGPVAPDIEARLAASHAVLSRSPDNLGLGHALNAVAEAAEAEGFTYLLLLDQDSVPPLRLAEVLAGQFDHLPSSAAALSPRLVSPDGEHYLEPWYARRGAAGADITLVDFLPTSGTLLLLAAWRRIGPFRTDFFIDGIDVEWCFRAGANGYACYLAETIAMPHRWGDATAQARRKPQILRQSLTRSFYYLRNTAASLRLSHMPLRWRLRSCLRIMAQAALLLAMKPLSSRTWRTVSAALSRGLRGQLGPIPPGLG